MAPVAAGVSILGTVAGIVDANQRAAQQRRAIDAQIAAQRQAQAIRQQQYEFQQRMGDQQYLIESAQNQFNAAIEKGQLEIALAENRLRLSQGLSQVGAAQAQNEIQRLATEFQAQAQNFMRQQEANKAENEALNEASAGLTDLANINMKIQDALEAGNLQLASQYASQAAQASGVIDKSKSGKEAISAKQSAMEFEAAMQMLQSGSVSSQLLDSVLRSTEFADLLRQLGLSESSFMMGEANRQAANNAANLQTGLRALESSYGSEDKNIRGAMNLLPGKAAIIQGQTNINRLAQDAGLASEATLSKSQTASNIAQLNAQKPQGVGILGTIAAIGQASMPLFSLFMQPSKPSIGTSTNIPLTQNPQSTVLDFDSRYRMSNWIA